MRIPLNGALLAMALMFSAQPSAHAGGTCPKLLMFDGVDIRTQTTPAFADYWGHTVGVEGFFLNDVMGMWQTDVGTDSNSAVWKQAVQFQRLYAAAGVTDNYIKVAIYKPHDWNSDSANASVVTNFAHAAALAKAAGFRGIAVDMEPNVPNWGGAAGGPGLTPVVYKEGQAIGHAMHQAYPGMTLVIMQDVLYWAGLNNTYNGGYSLAVPFLKGLLSTGFDHVVFASERTYRNPDVGAVISQTHAQYREFKQQGVTTTDTLSVAPGLWPLGKSNSDKSARQDVAAFEKELQDAMKISDRYVWIYGAFSAWQTDGVFSKNTVDKDFPLYLAAVHRARQACK